MRIDEIDEALRRQPAWDPPAHFGQQVAARLPAQPHAVASAPALTVVWHTVAGMASNCSAMVSGCTWMLRQYWTLLAR